MYLPKSQYTLKSLDEIEAGALTDTSGNLVKIAGKNIVVTSFGAYYDKGTVDLSNGNFSNAKRLIPLSTSEDRDEFPSAGNTDLRKSLDSIVPLKLPPTSEDRRNGVMVRCFYNNKCTGQLFEISKTQLTKLYRTQDKCVSTASINWIIKGPAQNQTLNGYFLEGVASLNQKTVNQLATIIPGIEAILPDPTEYLEELTIPGAQQPQTTPLGLNIPAPSK